MNVKFLDTPIGKVVAEALRWGVLAFVSQLLVLLPQINQTTDVVTLTMILRFIDAVAHKSGIAQKGIVRF